PGALSRSAFQLPQLLLQRCVTLFGDVLDGPGPVDRYHRSQRTDEPIVLPFDRLELRRRFVPFELGASAADALERDVDRDVEKEGQVRLPREAVGSHDELVRHARTLVS